ncbi:pyridoxamine 5'-phosphate oxidase family protein [Nocardia sp. NPDC003693]
MTSWSEFVESAPRISTIFARRHAATGNLCMLGTTRADGSPRISPLEPRIFEGDLWLVGMPRTTKFKDLERDPRFCLHTATVDTQVGDGDAKLFGTVHDVLDEGVRGRWLETLFEETGMDFRGEKFDHFYAADITGGSAVELIDGKHMEVTIWKPGSSERVVRKD